MSVRRCAWGMGEGMGDSYLSRVEDFTPAKEGEKIAPPVGGQVMKFIKKGITVE